jgi:hypothetical protein
VTEATYERGYKIRLRFNDGLEAVVDLERTPTEAPRQSFRATADPAACHRFRVEFDTLAWDSGLDLAPEYLHALAKASAAA